jgi:hypothetical protein
MAFRVLYRYVPNELNNLKPSGMDIAGFPASSSKEDVSKLFPYGSKIFLHDGQYWILLEHFEGATLKPESKLKVIAPGELPPLML